MTLFKPIWGRELKVICQTLDFLDQATIGLKRFGLLVAHGIRLRQIVWAMWPAIAARGIEQMTRN